MVGARKNEVGRRKQEEGGREGGNKGREGGEGIVRDLRDFWFKFFQKHQIWLICPLWYTV